MKVQSIVFIGAIVILCILNIPGSPVSVKLSLTSVLLAVSTVSSGLIYYFLNNIPDSQYSLLVSSSKSVVVWHSIYTCKSLLPMYSGANKEIMGINYLQTYICVYCGKFEFHMTTFHTWLID